MASASYLRKAGIGLGTGLGIGVLASGGIIFAQDGGEVADSIADLVAAIDTAWLLIAGFLVFFMQAGFGLLEAGFVRVKNTTNILMKNVMDASLGILVYWAVGFGRAVPRCRRPPRSA